MKARLAAMVATGGLLALTPGLGAPTSATPFARTRAGWCAIVNAGQAVEVGWHGSPVPPPARLFEDGSGYDAQGRIWGGCDDGQA